jgi:voltage-gated potassium channel Kch
MPHDAPLISTIRAHKLREEGVQVVVGNAASSDVLARAAPERARLLMVAVPDGFETGQVVQKARQANSRLVIVARAHSDDEVIISGASARTGSSWANGRSRSAC